MPIRPIRLLGDPVLRKISQPVTEVTEEIHSLIRDLFETLDQAEGVGLAAPQVGVLSRVMVIDTREEGATRRVLINPEVTSQEGVISSEEGCLSIPGITVRIKRAARVEVSALGGNGQPVTIQGEGLLSRVLQHEIDHLDGRLIIDRVAPLARERLIAQYTKLRDQALKARKPLTSSPVEW